MDWKIFGFIVKCNSREHTVFKCIVLLGLLWGVACQKAGMDNESRPPNILLILTDDQGWGDLGFHGNDSISTPVLDSLARRSIRLDRFYVSPVCAPTRASLLTGRYHLRTGVSFVTARREVMRSEEVTIAEVLCEQNYRTGIFGKWHNGEHYPQDALGQGFETFFGFSAGAWPNYFNTTLFDGREKVTTKGFITDVLTDRALEFIREHRDQPFFCYVPFNAPHSPYQAPDAYFQKYKALGLGDKNAAVYGMVENIDDNVGRLLQTLEDLDLKENTIVVFLTDNGPNGRRFNGGMRGTKASVHEGGSRVPCLISWPGTLPADREMGELAAHIDLMPTLLELAGIPLPEGLDLDGKSLAPLLRGQETAWPDRHLFTAHRDWDPTKTAGAVRSNQYRMVVEMDGITQLYDMEKDPAQTTDLSGSMPQVAEDLRREFDAWLQEATAAGLDPPPIPVGHPEASRAFLPAPEATLNGQLKFKGVGWANDWITGWQAKGDEAVWPIRIERFGYYDISLFYNLSAAGEPPVFQIKVGDKLFTTTIATPFEGEIVPSPDRIPRSGVMEKSWGKWTVKVIDLKPGPTEFKVKLQNMAPGLEFELKGVEIRLTGVEG